MSGFETNPFADPNADPFSDQVVTQARGGQRADTYDDFNPFANDQFSAKQEPAVLLPSNDPPPYSVPSPSTSAAVTAATEDLRRRQEELDRKAEDLERREREMQRTSQGQQGTINNFPPLPACCPIKPCFYQDFVIDIPSEFQRIVKALYYLWISYVCLLFLNIIASLTYFITSMANSVNNESSVTFGLSIIYFFIYTPCSFVCWYRPVYKAFRSDSSINFFIFFLVFFCQGCTCVVQCLGIMGSGTVGFLSGVAMMTTHKGVGCFMLVVGGLFAAMATACYLLLIRVQRYYRSTGASFEKAQAEFSHGVVTNRTVQETASGVATAAATGALNQYGSGSNRY